MRQSTFILTIAALVTQVISAPQFITFEDGKLGVNFGGYHAGVGIGGGAGKGAAGGLYAEAGTPFGQEARAGLGGDVSGSGAASGGLYAGATAGGNVKAEAGLSGAVAGDKSVGSGFANAQAGKAHAASGLGGEASAAGSHGFTYSSKSGVKHTEVIKEKEVIPVPVQPVEIARPTYKKIHKEFKIESANEVQPEVQKEFTDFVALEEQAPPAPPAPTIVKEVSSRPWIENRNQFDFDYDIRTNIIERPFNFGSFFDSVFRMPQPVYEDRQWWTHRQKTFVRPEQVVYQPVVYEKHRVRKPHHHFRKTAFLGGYIGAQGAIAPPPPPPPPPAPVVYKTVQPVIQKRIDVVAESAPAPPPVQIENHGAGQVAYTKQVTFQRNPTFFADIFNIPISTLKAVGNFLGNTAASTSVSVQKSASVQAGGHYDSDAITPDKNASVMSMGGLVIQTPTASKFIDDIFAIPINTLGAVNKFLENNVPARKQVSVDSDAAPTKVRLGPHARRRANKHVVVYKEEASAPAESVQPNSD